MKAGKSLTFHEGHDVHHVELFCFKKLYSFPICSFNIPWFFSLEVDHLIFLKNNSLALMFFLRHRINIRQTISHNVVIDSPECIGVVRC